MGNASRLPLFLFQRHSLAVCLIRMAKDIYTLEEFLSLSPGELLDLENIGYETLIRTKKALDKMGIAW